MTHALRDPWLKYDRAAEHFQALYAHVADARGQRGVYRVWVEYEPQEGCHLLYLAVQEDPALANEIGLLLGDFTHNARGALDTLTWQLALAHLSREPTEKEAKSIQFPLAKRPEDFASVAVLGLISEDAAERIKAFQPYHAPHPARDPLAVLNWLSNRDKHRLVHPTMMQAVVNHLTFATRPAEIQITRSRVGPIRQKDESSMALQRLYLDPCAAFDPADVEIDVKGEIPFDIPFSGPVENLYAVDLQRVLSRTLEVLVEVGELLRP